MLRQIILLLSWSLPFTVAAQYKGTGFVTHGSGQVQVTNLLVCSGGRVAAVGTIKDSSGQSWTVPADVAYTNAGFPFASDLYNSCTGKTYGNAGLALKALTGTDIVTVDPGGELITAFVFADNYFEMYINGIPVGKDRVPFTPFNSSIIRFRAKRPFTIAMHLVDWEEALGLGTELNGGMAYHPGDGGMAASFTDSTGNVIALTDKTWKAQTFYTAPVKDLACPEESGVYRYSGQCSVTDANDGSSWYGLHWKLPRDWMSQGFNDTAWPPAFEYSNDAVGVNNKPAYTNFTDVFDKPGSDARFIWSSNLILDNEVLVRYTVGKSAATSNKSSTNAFITNPVYGQLKINTGAAGQYSLVVFDGLGRVCLRRDFSGPDSVLDLSCLKPAAYIIEICNMAGHMHRQKVLLIQP